MGRKRGVQFKMGSFYRSCDRSGFVIRAENTRQEWQDLIVQRRLWEIRQPQDLVEGVPDYQDVPDARPKLPELFQGPINIALAMDAPIGATFLYLTSLAGISAGDNVGVMMDSGEYFNTQVSGPPTSEGINIAGPLPGAAAQGNVVTDYENPGP